MVSVLAFDSAGSGCSAAVLSAGRILAHRRAATPQGQAEALMPTIAAVLAEAAMAVEAFDLIAVTVGPGSFTGLRIGIAAARGLAVASGVPALGITSFAAVAAQVPAEERASHNLVVALESKRAEIYIQAFAADGMPRGEAALVPPSDFARRVPAGPLLLAGDAAPRLAAALSERAPRLASGPGTADAADVARLGAAAWRPGQRPPAPRPLYLRAPDTTTPSPGPVRR
jgi:tRNA threonylcarbamoyladenosine biosynthesis protein TsaB